MKWSDTYYVVATLERSHSRGDCGFGSRLACRASPLDLGRAARSPQGVERPTHPERSSY